MKICAWITTSQITILYIGWTRSYQAAACTAAWIQVNLLLNSALNRDFRISLPFFFISPLCNIMFVHFPCSSSWQSASQNVNTWQQRFLLQIAAAARLINRMKIKLLYQSQKLKVDVTEQLNSGGGPTTLVERLLHWEVTSGRNDMLCI